MVAILKYPRPELLTKCKEVTEFDSGLLYDIRRLKRVFASKEAYPAVGLAAPQIGLTRRLFVATLETWLKDDCGKSEPEVFINPEILEGEGSLMVEEQCLSMYRISVKVPRFQRIFIRAQNEHGEYFERELFDDPDPEEKKPACIFQHELDHLDGILAVNRMRSATSQKRIMRTIRSMAAAKT